jgi:glutamyl-tRNA reductase
MAAAAVRLAGQLFEDLKTSGATSAGEMIDLAATHFAAQPKSHGIANHTGAARKLATRFAEVMRLADLPSRLHEFDASSAAPPAPCPSSAWGRRGALKTAQAPMFMVDLAARDIES